MTGLSHEDLHVLILWYVFICQLIGIRNLPADLNHEIKLEQFALEAKDTVVKRYRRPASVRQSDLAKAMAGEARA